MAKEYVKHDEEFKKMIVNLCETSKDKTMSDIAREYGITRASITQWRKKYGTIITSTGEVTNNDEILKLKKELQQVQWVEPKTPAKENQNVEGYVKGVQEFLTSNIEAVKKFIEASAQKPAQQPQQ